MKLSNNLSLNQSLSMTKDLTMAIALLSKSHAEIDSLVEEELAKNPCLHESQFEHVASFSGSSSSFEVALATLGAERDFRDRLLAQLGESRLNLVEVKIAEYIIHSLDDDGLLADYPEVAAKLNDLFGYYPEWVDIVRRKIMDFEPIGCGARTINESLHHQVVKLGCDNHPQFLDLLKRIESDPNTSLNPSNLLSLRSDANLANLKNLRSRPARTEQSTRLENYLSSPELILHQSGKKLLVTLTKRASARILVSEDTVNLAKNSGLIKKNLAQANFLRSALKHRENTLLLVAKAIVHQQIGFFTSNAPLKPLTLSDIALYTGLSESSVSRLVNEKFIATDLGVFELKYFFSSKISSSQAGEDHSSRTIKEALKKLLKSEDKKNPHSDEKICAELKQRGYSLSRRTVAKYRDQLGIGSRYDRRVLIA